MEKLRTCLGVGPWKEDFVTGAPTMFLSIVIARVVRRSTP